MYVVVHVPLLLSSIQAKRRMRIMVDRLPVARSLARWHCETCDVSFTFKRALQRHDRESATHSRNTDAPVYISSPHECAVCKQTFRREFDLGRHFAEQHADGKKPCSAWMGVIRPGIPHKDDSGNDCSGRAAEPTVTQMEVDQVISNETRLSYIDEDVSSTTSSTCNYCRKSFQNQASEALRRHPNNHLVELTQWHECTTCDVFFQNSRDLELHRQWAESHGYCGLNFEHQGLCRGHRTPIIGDFENSQMQQQDRHAFCVSLRSWEYTQLKLYRQRVGELLTPQVQVSFATTSADKAERSAERRTPVEYLAAALESANDRTVNPDKRKIQRTRTEHRRPADALRKKNGPQPAIPIQTADLFMSILQASPLYGVYH